MIGMNLWWILYIIDGLLFTVAALTVLYLFIFAIASLFYKHDEINRAKRQNRFIIIIPSYRRDDVIMQSVNSILGQTYPQRLFDIVVVSDHQSEMTNMRLAQLPITLLTPDFIESSKAKSLQYAILNLPKFKIYDAVLILDADNLVEPEFLEQANDAYESAGTKAIQMHRLTRNRDTSMSRLDSIFEEIDNSIFRLGHNVLGFSSALNGSGMIYDFEWFKSAIMKVKTSGEDKELEAMLLRDGIFIEFFSNIYVYDEKTRNMAAFNRQRGRWAATQLHILLNNLPYLPSALLNRRYDLIDKLLQWILVPRTILMGVIMVMSITLPFIYFSLAIKWWIAAAVIMFAFSVATPDHLVDKNWDRDFLHAPIVILWGLGNIVWIGIKEMSSRILSARKAIKRNFIHTK